MGVQLKTPAYECLDKLVNHRWRTRLRLQTTVGRSVRFRGFYGNYRLKIRCGSDHSQHTIHLGRTGDNIHQFAV